MPPAKKVTARQQPVEPPPAASDKLPRGAKRKRDTRARLLTAALHLMAYRGVAGVTIHEITEQADVGFGSFYNHFESKEALHGALIDEVISHFAVALDRLGEQLTDPAEKVAASTRYTLLRGMSDPTWGRFVFQTNFSRDSMSSGLGRYLLQDMGAGLASGRFTIADLPAAYIAAGSTILGALAAISDQAQADSDETERQPALFGDAQTLPERIAAIVLTILGLPTDEAHQIAGRPLPQIELPANPFAPA
ncbi:MAG: TetR/AcrR family transcriptional regulator [Rubrivivax sp.]|nr:MAG: TetR/AcrR family transcriptional regulator [Rubrivivax sp.]